MSSINLEYEINTEAFRLAVKKRSDKLMNYFLACFFLTGFALAIFYDTWLIALTIGSLSLTAYYGCKIALPGSDLYQYVLSIILGIFMAQFIYQMHGMFEMHFFAFIGSAILITYQNWKLQIPLLLVVGIHHGTFSYLQNIGIDKIYFSQLDYFDLQTFIIHILLTATIFFICGLWAYQLKKYNEKYIGQSLKMGFLQKEILLNIERKEHSDTLQKSYTKAEHARQQAEDANQATELAYRELEIKNKEIEQFAYIASHDLQEPLRTTSGFVKLIQKQYQGKFDDNADRYLNYIMESTERMKDMVKNLLEYSRIGSKKELIHVNCEEILRNVLADLHASIIESKAEINYGSLPLIYAFSTEIKQLFQNLIINAIKFRKKGDIPMINISAKKLKNEWEFTFADNGIGIEKQHQEKIFVIFQRLHNQKEYEGSGIGLSYCKKIVELHKGKIWVDSIPGTGSSFHFTIAEKIKSNNVEKQLENIPA